MTSTPPRILLLAVAGLGAGAFGQSQSQLPTPQGGLSGQRADFPNVLSPDATLPINRHITLPGLPTAPGPNRVAPVPAVVGGPGTVVGTDGVRINGQYNNGDFSLNFHLGSGLRGVVQPGVLYGRDGYYYAPYGWSRTSPWWRYRYGEYYSNAPVDGVLTQRVDYSLRAPQLTQPPAPAQEPPRELTAIEKARLLMAADELDSAIASYRDHLDTDPEDVKAMREMGLAMIEDDRPDDGVAMVALAYRTDPSLARAPIELAPLGLDGRRYDSLLAKALQFARRTDSGSAHLVGAILLQADGKYSGAARVLDRAEKAGLSGDVLDPVRREIGRPANNR
ncbi:MAG: hypothetical protein IPJ41_04770 [Phycisphaerales bacterium]|nr:hypothetical protein [Phycisphaerales bacterium]